MACQEDAVRQAFAYRRSLPGSYAIPACGGHRTVATAAGVYLMA